MNPLPYRAQTVDESKDRDLNGEFIREAPVSVNGAFELYLKEIGELPLLKREEEFELIQLSALGDVKAQELLIKGNLRLVVKLASEYTGNGMALLDLISEGNLGLVRGIKKFDPANGCLFATYLHFCIKQSILTALTSQSRLIRLPSHWVGRQIKMRRFTEEYSATHHTAPSPESIAKALDISVKEVAKLERFMAPVLSMDSTTPSEINGLTLEEMLPDEKQSGPDASLDRAWITNWLHSLVDTLKPKYAAIIRKRFGLDGTGESTTIEEIGRHFGISHQRASRIISQGVTTLKTRCGSQLKRDMLQAF